MVCYYILLLYMILQPRNENTNPICFLVCVDVHTGWIRKTLIHTNKVKAYLDETKLPHTTQYDTTIVAMI